VSLLLVGIPIPEQIKLDKVLGRVAQSKKENLVGRPKVL